MRSHIAKTLFAGFLAFVFLSTPAFGGVLKVNKDDDQPTGKGHGSSSALGLATTVPGYGINYHGGPVMTGATNIYYIWYGDWTALSASQQMIRDFGNAIGGSDYFNINTTYSDASNGRPSNVVNLYKTEYIDTGSLGTKLTDANVLAVVNKALTSLPLDPNGVYFILTDPTVTETSGFCTSYCGWHNVSTISGIPIKYSFVGNPKTQCPTACAPQTVSPNGDPAADGMVSVMAHELEETVSDPQLNAWYDTTGMENGDKCAWNFGLTYTVNGAKANMKMGSRDFYIQQNWVNTPPSGACVLGYNSTLPTVTSVSPSVGSAAGSVNITMTGTNFTGATAVSLGGTPVKSFAITNATTLTAVTPAHAAGPVTIAVTTPAGSVTSSTNLFTYSDPATIAAVSPSTGTTAGGTTIAITGTNFTGTTAVSLGGTPVKSFTITSATTITAVTAAAATAGPVTIAVTTPSGTVTSSTNLFTYSVPPPTITAVSPKVGATAGGTTLTLTGTNLTGATAVSVGGTPVTSFAITNATTLTAVTPAHAAGPVTIAVTTPAGSVTSSTNLFTYSDPATIAAVSPSTGTTAGGTTIAITGTNFTGTTAVSLGGTPVKSFTITSATTITAVTAAAATAGPVTIAVTTPSGTVTSSTNLFTYSVPPPTITSVSPNTGTTAGGTAIALTGTNFTGATAVSVGGGPVTSLKVISATSITAVTPAHILGAVPIAITVGGVTTTSPQNIYTYK